MPTPSDFPEANFTFTKPQSMEDCGDLRVQRHGDGLLSCWRLSWRERLSALAFGTVWLNVLSDRHPPVWIVVERDVHRAAAMAEGGQDDDAE